MKKKLSKKFSAEIIASLVIFLFGLLLLLKSEITIIAITYVIGATLIGLGFLAVIKFTKNFKQNTGGELDIVYGIVTIIMGLIVIKNPKVIGSIIPIILGMIIIIKSTAKLQESIELKVKESEMWLSTLIISIVSLICGVVLLFNPFQGAVILTQIIGGFIMLYSALDIASTIIISKTVNDIIKEAEIVEAEVKEEKEEPKKIEEKKTETKKKPAKKATKKTTKKEDNNDKSK